VLITASASRFRRFFPEFNEQIFDHGQYRYQFRTRPCPRRNRSAPSSGEAQGDDRFTRL